MRWPRRPVGAELGGERRRRRAEAVVVDGEAAACQSQATCRRVGDGAASRRRGRTATSWVTKLLSTSPDCAVPQLDLHREDAGGSRAGDRQADPVRVPGGGGILQRQGEDAVGADDGERGHRLGHRDVIVEPSRSPLIVRSNAMRLDTAAVHDRVDLERRAGVGADAEAELDVVAEVGPRGLAVQHDPARRRAPGRGRGGARRPRATASTSAAERRDALHSARLITQSPLGSSRNPHDR